MPKMEKLRRNGLIWVLACAGISSLWGTFFALGGNEWIDFRAVYVGTRCLIHEHNPYSVSELEREYLTEDGQRPRDTPFNLQGVVYDINLPTTLVILAPIAALPWGPAHILWMLATGCALILAILLIWDAGARHSPPVSTFLACLIAVNCESIFSSGNTAGIVVGLCGIAVWCFLEDRYVPIGVICLGLSLAVKPHDGGLVWLYFVLAGGANRKRAMQSVVITAAICLISVLWVSHVAPTWMHDWNTNIATTSAPGGINNPGPNGAKSGALFSIVDLQAPISIFRDDPHFYNLASYLICGTLLLIWAIWTLRRRSSVINAWLGLASVSALTLLITYHRLWDAKLMMLAIPACCLLWAEGGSRGKAAILVTAIAAFFTGEVSLVLFEMALGALHMGTNGIVAQAITVVLTRPASLALLAMGVFYLWAYLRQPDPVKPASSVIQEIECVSE
jgi:hypothetical protein